jgi:hypothetical protein
MKKVRDFTKNKILEVFMKKTYKESKINEIKKRADKRKNNLKLRHNPNERDITIALENTKFMQPAQYATLHDE